MQHKSVITGMLVVAALLTFGFSAVRPLYWPYVYSGVYLEGVEVSGKTREEVAQLLLFWQNQYRTKTLTVYYGDTNYRIAAQDIEFEIDVESTLDEVWHVGRRGSWPERLRNIKNAKQEGYRVPVRFRYNENKLANLFEQWKEAIDRPPRNAALSIVTGDIVPQEPGRRLEVELLRPALLSALRKKDAANVALPVTPLYPEITVADIAQTGIRELLGQFTTVFDDKDVNRTANVKLAARKINGHIVYPGQVFSFNETVGPRDKAHGFREALEIVDGEFVPGVGGGVCQVSSTLYNSALLANLAIVERTNHSKPLVYVPIGRDATVAYGVIDFKFKNTLDFPVMIMAETQGNKLHIGLFGQQRFPGTVEIVSTDRQVIPPSVVKRQDQALYLGETKVDRQGKPGYEVTTIRIVRMNGREIKREVLSKDRYLPEDTVVKVGTRMPDFKQDKM
ncbi:MAG: VanW family protein [Negativicutes bacterium]|nr:VanW family protein [Negativicutes bacterium]